MNLVIKHDIYDRDYWHCFCGLLQDEINTRIEATSFSRQYLLVRIKSILDKMFINRRAASHYLQRLQDYKLILIRKDVENTIHKYIFREYVYFPRIK